MWLVAGTDSDDGVATLVLRPPVTAGVQPAAV
jgi:3-oxoacyl-[acyl-carrier-protein] synthase II